MKLTLEAMAAAILTPDNHQLFEVVRDQLNDNPEISLDATARGLGVTVEDLCRWFIGFKERRLPVILPAIRAHDMPRDPELRAELIRLRRREASLVTVATEAPEQLERVQRRIISIARAH